MPVTNLARWRQWTPEDRRGCKRARQHDDGFFPKRGKINTFLADTYILKIPNNIVIEVVTASFRSVRGFTLVAALCDEIAFWQGEDSATPDSEILAALRPAMATIPNSMLLCASSPYARRGALYDNHKAHFGKDGDSVLVV
jgi:hypothetical protein